MPRGKSERTVPSGAVHTWTGSAGLACLRFGARGTPHVHVVEHNSAHGQDVSKGLNRRDHIAVQHHPQQDRQNALQLGDHFQRQGRSHPNDNEGGDVGQETQGRHVEEMERVRLHEPHASTFDQPTGLRQQGPEPQENCTRGGNVHQGLQGAQVVTLEERLYTHDTSCFAEDREHEQRRAVCVGVNLAHSRQHSSNGDEPHGEVQCAGSLPQLQGQHQHQCGCRCEGFEHLDEGDGEVEVWNIPEVEGGRGQCSHKRSFRHQRSFVLPAKISVLDRPERAQDPAGHGREAHPQGGRGHGIREP
eukprot:scaffold739_cov295-Pavlova_lutheri.AAC.5